MDEVVDGGLDGDEDDVKSFQDPSSGVVDASKMHLLYQALCSMF